MLPNNTLSREPVPGGWIYDVGLEPNATLDFKPGGRGIQDPYAGLDFQVWRGRIFQAGTEDSHIVLDGRFSPEYVFHHYPNMVEFNFSFDFNMKPMIVFIAREVRDVAGDELVEYNTYLYWYDTTVQDYAYIPLGPVIKTPRLVVDDPREVESQYYSKSDVCLFYWRSGNLYLRYLRDRFTIEYLLKRNVPYIERVGLTNQYRLQIELLKEKQECVR